MSVAMETILNFLDFSSQLSDIHVSIYRDLDRVTDLKQFVSQVMKTVNPSLVVVTGDLTDAVIIKIIKQLDQYLSRQYEKEWVMYSSAITDVRVPWLDMRGNHGEELMLERADTSGTLVRRKTRCPWCSPKHHFTSHPVSVSNYHQIGQQCIGGLYCQ